MNAKLRMIRAFLSSETKTNWPRLKVVDRGDAGHFTPRCLVAFPAIRAAPFHWPPSVGSNPPRNRRTPAGAAAVSVFGGCGRPANWMARAGNRFPGLRGRDPVIDLLCSRFISLPLPQSRFEYLAMTTKTRNGNNQTKVLEITWSAAPSPAIAGSGRLEPRHIRGQCQYLRLIAFESARLA